ncbi:hypothetical protein T492DRAFT_1104118 [Pavlovales sp. CCMP2436]|nr:hypothetical protein T492DRAFT_1104118 [Pavlovales sp. CCMP2436]
MDIPSAGEAAAQGTGRRDAPPRYARLGAPLRRCRPLLVLCALLLVVALSTASPLPSLPSLEEAEGYIDQAAASVWNAEVGGKALVGATAGALIGLLAKQLSDVIHMISMSLAGLIAFRVFTSFRPDTFGSESIQDILGELQHRAGAYFNENKGVLARVAPFVKRQGPFVVGFVIGLAVTASKT